MKDDVLTITAEQGRQEIPQRSSAAAQCFQRENAGLLQQRSAGNQVSLSNRSRDQGARPWTRTDQVAQAQSQRSAQQGRGPGLRPHGAGGPGQAGRRSRRHRGSGRQGENRLQGDAGLQRDARPIPDSTGWAHAARMPGPAWTSMFKCAASPARRRSGWCWPRPM